MIYAYFSDYQGMFKGDKNSREVTSYFNKIDISRFKLESGNNIMDCGSYHYAAFPYGMSEESFIKNYCKEMTIIEEVQNFYNKCRELHVEVPPTNELKIREAVKTYLNTKYKIEYMQDEYTHTSLPVRADLFAVTKNKKVITVEIKSDRDTFTRLKKQLEEYTKFSHIVYLAIDIKHLERFRKNFPSYYGGILVYEDNELKLYTACCRNENVDTTRLLWKQELFAFVNVFDGSFSKYNIEELNKFIYNIFTVQEFYKISEYLFVNRYLHEKKNFKHMIKDFEYKNKLIQKFIKNRSLL